MVLYFHPKGLYFHPTWISLGAVKGALEGLKVNWIMLLPCLQFSSGFPLPFNHNPTPFQAGLALSQLFTPHPLPVLTWSTLLHAAPTAPAILRFLNCGRFVLVFGSFLLVVSFSRMPFLHIFAWLASLTWVSESPSMPSYLEELVLSLPLSLS